MDHSLFINRYFTNKAAAFAQCIFAHDLKSNAFDVWSNLIGKSFTLISRLLSTFTLIRCSVQSARHREASTQPSDGEAGTRRIGERMFSRPVPRSRSANSKAAAKRSRSTFDCAFHELCVNHSATRTLARVLHRV